jgi:hypothetical protein
MLFSYVRNNCQLYISDDVIYFFVEREIFIHTVFEPHAKKHLPLFSRFIKKNPPFLVEATLLDSKALS